MDEVYVHTVNAFLKANKIVFVVDGSQTTKTLHNVVPKVDARVLINSPGVDVDDVVRDAVLLKLFGYDEASADVLRVLQKKYAHAKSRVADDFVNYLYKGVFT